MEKTAFAAPHVEVVAALPICCTAAAEMSVGVKAKDNTPEKHKKVFIVPKRASLTVRETVE